MLSLFVRAKSLTVAQIHEKLAEKFSVSYHSIASMVGTIASKLGILSSLHAAAPTEVPGYTKSKNSMLM